jgi:signal peptidase I
MQIPQIRTSRWFIYVSSGLIVFLCLSVLLAGLILLSKSSQPLTGQVAGSSMEPTLQGPRLLVTCSVCQAVNQFSIDAWNPKRPASCPCCSRSILTEDEPPIQHGDTLRYTLLRWLRNDSIQRGDVVVLERESGSLKALKRVVGLPDEQITLRDGDLWINDRRYEKTLRETLRQSVLVAAWDPRFCDRSLDSFLDSLSLPLTNELPINAHDSHAIIPTRDVGIALRFVEPIQKGRLATSLSDSSHRYDIDVFAREDWLVSCNGNAVPRISTGQGRGGGFSQWIIVACIDGRVLVGDEFGTCFASPLESMRSAVEDDPPTTKKQSMTISSMKELPTMDLVLVFRDLVYRGYGDTAEETIPAGPGYVVLGDNISISDDSRGPLGGSTRWGREQIKGVLLRDSNDLASLLRQSDQLRRCGCRSNELE